MDPIAAPTSARVTNATRWTYTTNRWTSLTRGARSLVDGTIVRPWVKFAGQTSYTAGVATPAVSVDPSTGEGEFTWQRRTGKKTYVYLATEDGATRSTRVIISAK